MRKLRLVLPLLPVSLNKVKRWMYAGQSWRYTRKVKEWERAVRDEIIRNTTTTRLRPLIKYASITVEYYFKVRRGRDLDNYSGFKPLLDALKGQVIEDDRDDWVKVSWELLRDKNNPRTEIIVEEKG